MSYWRLAHGRGGRIGRAGIVLVLLAALPGQSGATSADLRLLPPASGMSEERASDWRSGFGLDGYDPVAYLMDGSARSGRPEHEAAFGGFVWRFASAANRAAFLRDPETFLPRVGGYDAAAAAEGRLSAADPLLFVVRSARTYLFRTEAGRQGFLRAADADKAAEAGWRRLRPDLVLG